MKWQDFEDQVRTIASFRWNCDAHTETIAGVKCDCVLKIDSDNWIVVEITKENELSKVRTDISKLFTIRNSLFMQQIYCKCYFVMKDKPTDSMRAAGNEQKINVLSAEEFQSEYFNYKTYVFNRQRKQFGSLVNSETGQPESNTYISVTYSRRDKHEEYKIEDIITALKRGKRIILKGDFGVGKSRCIKQLFDLLSADTVDAPYAIAINLREHWGSKRGIEILTRHFSELGLDFQNFIKSYEQPRAIYLLDGFDEIGTQSWSCDVQKMQHIREISICAIKDLLSHVEGGVLITGRDYYFNSDAEMLNCLGLSNKDVLILECHSEFSENELLSFISKNIPEESTSNGLEKLPVWFPKRPLVIQLLLKYASEVFSIKYAMDGICGFWYAFLTKICEREAKIYPSLNPEVIKKVLILLANKTRLYSSNTGPITQNDLSEAFQKATGFQPNDESAIMLQRLPSLGRIDADSPNRQFLDIFILNALRSEGIIQAVNTRDEALLSEEWKNPLDDTGCCILSEYIAGDIKRKEAFLSIARKASNQKNAVLLSDIVAALCLLDDVAIDFQNIYVENGHFINLHLEAKSVRRLTISESIIENLDITNAKIDEDFTIKNCIIGTILGIASQKSTPVQIEDCTVDRVESMATTTLIKKARLSEPQKLFIEMVRKIFFQPGAGRKEAALLRGMGTASNKPLGKKILNMLLDEHLVTKHKGDEGYIYKPVRKETKRIDRIVTDLTLSKDPLWERISKA